MNAPDHTDWPRKCGPDILKSPRFRSERNRNAPFAVPAITSTSPACGDNFAALFIVLPPCRSRRSVGPLAVHHPRDAESIGNGTEAQRPEGLLNRHLHVAFLRQCRKHSFGLGRLLDTKRNGKALRLLKSIWRSVRAHDCICANHETGMHDLFSPLSRYLVGHRRVPEGHHHFDLAAQKAFIETERFLALTVEVQIGIQLHSKNSFRIDYLDNDCASSRSY